MSLSIPTAPSTAAAPRHVRRLVAAGAAAALVPLLALASPATAVSGDILEQVSPTPTTYVERTDFIEMQHALANNVTAPVWAAPLNLDSYGFSASGCSSADFAGFSTGSIALVRRGSCTFNQKASNALAAGAVGVIIPNDGYNPDRLGAVYGTLGTPVAIAVVGTSFAVGEDLRNGVSSGATGSVVHMVTDGLAPAVSTDAQLVALKDAVDATGASPTVTGPLQAKLDAAQAALDRDDVGAACNQLRAFENQVRAQSGKSLTTAQADGLLARAAQLRTDLGC